MPLHPRLAELLAQGPNPWLDLDAIASMTAAKARAWAAGTGAEAATVAHPGVAVEEVELPGGAGPLRGRVHRPTAEEPRGTLLWIRGGGFVLGSLASDWMPGPLAAACGCAVVALDYRLAPEHPYPCALEDCCAALSWVAEHAAQFGGDGIAVGGESAGGNLAAAVALAARERGGPPIALQALLWPMLARTFEGGSRHDPELGALARPEAIEWLWEQYLGERDGSDPLACPLEAQTLAGLPPAVVVTAEYDVLRDEAEAYAERLARDGVAVRLRRYDGMVHGFPEWGWGVVDAAQECLDYVGAAVRSALRSEG